MEGVIHKYVLGFPFSENTRQVLLIHKLKPEWQKGLLNGIGGHIERNELPSEAMIRECREETGLVLPWEAKGITKGTNNDGSSFECYIFVSYDDSMFEYSQIEDEPLIVILSREIRQYDTIRNVQYLIPMLSWSEDNFSFVTIDYDKGII